jgi:hypothetical protein
MRFPLEQGVSKQVLEAALDAVEEPFARQDQEAQPAAPQTRVGLPAGSPPPLISSSPSMPVGAFVNDGSLVEECGLTCFETMGGM